MSELDDFAKFISEATGEPCEADDILHVRRAKEPLAGSPLESVVQGRADSPVPSNPDVQGTPLLQARRDIIRLTSGVTWAAQALSHLGLDVISEECESAIEHLLNVALMIPCEEEKNNTARVTKTSSAGVP